MAIDHHMEIIQIANDIELAYVTATSFPEGINAAHEAIKSQIALSANNSIYGLSRPEKGAGIVYKAAMELLPGDAPTRLPTITLEKGSYRCITVRNFMVDPTAIGLAFQELLSAPGFDQSGYCVEWYFNETDVHCLIRLADQE